jgi:hypothetical protein
VPILEPGFTCLRVNAGVPRFGSYCCPVFLLRQFVSAAISLGAIFQKFALQHSQALSSSACSWLIFSGNFARVACELLQG